MSQVLESQLMINRTPQLIAVEINSIKDQTRKMLLYTAVEIGRRLTEAKSLVSHGEWGKWLADSVSYSQRTATNLMRIYEEYGDKPKLSLVSAESNWQTSANLNFSQAVALLGLAQGEREQFIQENDVENMSVRELEQVIKERDQALKEKESLRRDLENRNKEISQLCEQLDRLKTELKEAQEQGASMEEIDRLNDELQFTHEKVKVLTDQLNAPQIIEPSILREAPEEMVKELEELREKVKTIDETKLKMQNNKAAVKFSVHFDTLVKGFDELLKTLSEIAEMDPEVHAKYKNATTTLIKKMSERL